MSTLLSVINELLTKGVLDNREKLIDIATTLVGGTMTNSPGDSKGELSGVRDLMAATKTVNATYLIDGKSVSWQHLNGPARIDRVRRITQKALAILADVATTTASHTSLPVSTSLREARGLSEIGSTSHLETPNPTAETIVVDDSSGDSDVGEASVDTTLDSPSIREEVKLIIEDAVRDVLTLMSCDVTSPHPYVVGRIVSKTMSPARIKERLSRLNVTTIYDSPSMKIHSKSLKLISAADDAFNDKVEGLMRKLSKPSDVISISPFASDGKYIIARAPIITSELALLLTHPWLGISRIDIRERMKSGDDLFGAMAVVSGLRDTIHRLVGPAHATMSYDDKAKLLVSLLM